MVREGVGFIGLGNMGAPMARNLLAAGYRLAVHDTRPEAGEALLGAGAEGRRCPATRPPAPR